MTQQQKTGEYMDARNKEELHAQIDQTKSAIAGELRELGEKLSPEHLMEGMKDMLQEAKTEAKGAIMDAKNAVVVSLRNAKDHAIDSVSETVSEVSDRARRAGTVTADFVSANAIPLSLIGIGAGWLMLTMRRQRMLRESSYYGRDYGRSYERDYEYGQRRFGEWNERDFDDYGARRFDAQEDWGDESMLERARSEGRDLEGRAEQMVERGRQKVERAMDRTREGASQMRDRVQSSISGVAERANELGHTARDRAAEYSHMARERAMEYGQAARERAVRYSHNTVEYAQENPLAVSALAVAAGVGFGLMLPSSRIENRLMGPARGRLVGEARELIDDAKQAAQHAAQAAKETATEVKNQITSGPSH